MGAARKNSVSSKSLGSGGSHDVSLGEQGHRRPIWFVQLDCDGIDGRWSRTNLQMPEMGKLHAGLDVGDRTTAVCVVNDDGEPLFETSVATTPEAIAESLMPYKRRLKTVGQEPGVKAAWLHRELSRMKFPMCCLDAFHAHSVLRTRLNKTDANDAQGLALLLAKGMHSTAHIKSEDAIRIRIVLAMREMILRKGIDLELAVRSAEKQLGLHTGKKVRRRRSSPEDAEQAVALTMSAASDLNALASRSGKELTRLLTRMAKRDALCRRLMTIPGVGPLTALTFIASVDDPFRFENSRTVAAYFGLTPRTMQSGLSSRTGGVSRRGDGMARKALFSAARSLLVTSRSESALRLWGLRLAKAKGYKVAYVACARKLAVLMHRLWVTGEEFDAKK